MGPNETTSGICTAGELSVLLSQSGLIAKTLMTGKEIVQAYRLRHRVFCEELGWLDHAADGLESDVYDRNAVFFGVLDEAGCLLAFLRLLLPDGPFMLEHEFRSLIGADGRLKKGRDTAEVSRLCIVPEKRNYRGQGNFEIHSLSLFLYQGVYRWCLSHGIRRLYLVIEYRFFRLLRSQKFPCRLLGEPGVVPDRKKSVAACMDWREYESENRIATNFSQVRSDRF